jgi:hypothetical protein
MTTPEQLLDKIQIINDEWDELMQRQSSQITVSDVLRCLDSQLHFAYDVAPNIRERGCYGSIIHLVEELKAKLDHDLKASGVEMIQAVGVDKAGKLTVLEIPLPNQSKFKDILGTYLGRNFDDEDSNESMALQAFKEWHVWFLEQNRKLN